MIKKQTPTFIGRKWPYFGIELVMVMVMVLNSAYTGPLPRYL